MLIENNTLLRIDQVDIIHGVFTAPDEVLYISSGLRCNTVLKMVLPNVVSIGYNFLYENTTLERLIMPKVEKIGSHFLYRNKSIVSIYMPNIKEIGYSCLVYNSKFNYTLDIVRALKGDMYIGDKKVDKKKYLRKIKIQKLLC